MLLLYVFRHVSEMDIILYIFLIFCLCTQTIGLQNMFFSPAPVQSKVEEKRPSLNNGGKESEEHDSQSKSPQTPKSEDSTPKVESPQKPKTPVQASPAKSEANSSAQTTPTKGEAKPTKAWKRKPKESGESKGQDSFEPKRRRRRTEPFQSPLPEIAMIVKTLSKPSVAKANDDKLIVFYKYVCLYSTIVEQLFVYLLHLFNINLKGTKK